LISNAWDVLFQDAVLTTSASRFVMTAHGTGWIDEDYTGVPGGVRVYDQWFLTYIDNVGALDIAIAKASEMSTTEQDLRMFSNIDRVNKLLVDLETIALTSVEPPDASALPANDTTLGITTLYGDTYMRAKLVYNAENQRFLSLQSAKVSKQLNRVLEGGRVQLHLAIVVDLVAFTLTAVLSWLKSRMVREAIDENCKNAEASDTPAPQSNGTEFPQTGVTRLEI